MKAEKCKSLSVVKEFSRFAHQYDRHNEIQSKVAARLIERLPDSSYRSILDLGCGSGELYKHILHQDICVEHYTALDSSPEMLRLHPSASNVTKICANFNDVQFYKHLPQTAFDIILSSSALQWSENLTSTLEQVSLLSPRFYGVLFTSGTFKTLHKTASISSPIYSVSQVEDAFTRCYAKLRFEVHTYTLSFASVRDMFRYIKRSGVSSGERYLSYLQTKRLMREYPLDHLEFEVVFIEASQ